MNVISTGHGFVLRFNDLEDMEEHIENLQGQKEWVKQEGDKPPYLYSVYYKETKPRDMQHLLDRIKEQYKC